MAYVEAHAGLRDHLKTKKVARLLGVPKVQVIGHMLCLWWWCQEYAQDGDLSGFDAADIADAAEWEGEPETFVNALLNCGAKGGAGFLHNDPDSGALLINDWYQYGGKLFIRRTQSAERMRKMRNNMSSDNDVTRNMSVTNANVTPLLHDVTPIDKIRIDNINTSSADAAPAGVPTSPNGEKPKPKRIKGENKPRPQNEYFGAVCAFVGWDCNVITEAQRGQVAQTMDVLQKGGYTIGDLRTFWRYWHEEDWRGQKGQRPTLSQLRSEIGKIRDYAPTPPANGKVADFDVTQLYQGGA